MYGETESEDSQARLQQALEPVEDNWPKVENWFRVQIERAKGKPRR